MAILKVEQVGKFDGPSLNYYFFPKQYEMFVINSKMAILKVGPVDKLACHFLNDYFLFSPIRNVLN